ncbi:Hpt domain [Citrobacter koseri]|nr:Hpt domain [Citrobacter koseri]
MVCVLPAKLAGVITLPATYFHFRYTGASRCVQGEFIGKLKLRLEQRDRDKVGRMAHRINGGARMMNYTPLKETCEALEVACNNEQDWETIEQLVKCVLEDMVRFNKWLAEKS